MPPSKRRRISEELEMGRRGLKFVRKLKRPREKERERNIPLENVKQLYIQEVQGV